MNTNRINGRRKHLFYFYVEGVLFVVPENEGGTGMNLVFLNSFEKVTELEGIVSAQVSIAEEFGEWRVWWHEKGDQTIPFQESWYTGMAWDEMIGEFRRRIGEKRRDGYRPLIEPDEGRQQTSGGRSVFVRKLELYGERHSDSELYESLRKWRSKQAASEGKSAFIVASNRMLAMISAFLPQTAEELQQIPGFGEQKSAMYGEHVLALTAGLARTTSFPLDWVDEAIGVQEVELWMQERQEERRKGEQAKKELKQTLLQSVAEGKTLSELEPLVSLSRRELMTRIEDLDKEGYEMEPLIEAELAAVPADVVEQAWQLFGSSGDRYLRPVLKRLYDEKSLDDEALSRAYEWLRLLRLRYRKTKSGVVKEEEAAAEQTA